ncbi:large ribosomal subunit protein mL65 [Culicoides brevitarsis]|uniref:large ribosomal subunit protein mL65 n=1 Tax=Culicoides brevitarsis TaxID=469753 RepID=UPI00307C4406
MSNLLKLNRAALRFVQNTKRGLATRVIENPEEYTEKPEYPPIVDISNEAKKKRAKERYHEEYKQVGTVEEKVIKLNLPKYYGFQCVVLDQSEVLYDTLNFGQYITRTVKHETPELPEFYKKNDEMVSKLAEKVKSEVEDVIGFEYSGYLRDFVLNNPKATPEEKERFLASNICFQLNRTLVNALHGDFPHLSECEVDLDPRHEAFWFVGGIDPPERVRSYRRGHEWTKKFEKAPVDRSFQHISQPYLTLRHVNPLPALENVNLEALNYVTDKVEVPDQKYDPRVYGYRTTHRHGTIVPGYWAGSAHEFGVLSYQRRDGLLKFAKNYTPEDVQEALHMQGITSSFAWAYAQAAFQGFTTFNEITYPLTSQTIITDGRLFSFYAYQMNTLLLHSEHAKTNPRYNKCWATPEMKLFEEVDASGKVIGFNPDVLKNLLHFYVNAPEKREDVDMKPYLDPKAPRAALIEDELRREFIEKTYKHLMANRKRHERVPETYLWEKFYKIDFKTRPMEPRRRPFELGINPFRRRLDDHLPEYVPRILRPGGYGGRRHGKSQEKWRPTFYPTTHSDRPRSKVVPNYPEQHKYEKINEEEYKELDKRYRKKE